MKTNIITLLSLLLLMGACQPSATLEDTSCRLPCWRSITAGETSMAEAKTRVSQMPDIDKTSIKLASAFTPGIDEFTYWRFTNRKEGSGSIEFSDNKVVLLDFWFTKRIALQDFIKIYKEPSDIIVLSSSTGDPLIYLTVHLIYPESGICLLHEASLWRNPDKYSLAKSTGISRINAIQPSLTDGQLTIGCLRGFTRDEYDKLVQPWKGYGNYKVLDYSIQK